MKTIMTIIAMIVATSASSATITIEKYTNGDPYILFTGEILYGIDNAALQTAIANTPAAKSIAFNSPGGSVYEGWGIAATIRQSQLSTYIPAYNECLSACTFAFMGGVTRYFSNNGIMGYHPYSYSNYGYGTQHAWYQEGQRDGVDAVRKFQAYVPQYYHWPLADFLTTAYKNSNTYIFYYANSSELASAGIVTHILD